MTTMKNITDVKNNTDFVCDEILNSIFEIVIKYTSSLQFESGQIKNSFYGGNNDLQLYYKFVLIEWQCFSRQKQFKFS